MITPHYADDAVTLYAGDCLDVLSTLPDNSVDAVVTDPPYSLSFMSAIWDTHATPADFQDWCTIWAMRCLRILKPGGHLLAFGGTRTWHRLAVAIEDAGFEIRDTIAYLYGSGFPKSLNVSKNESFCQCDPVPYNHDRNDLRGVRQGVSGLAADTAEGQESDLLEAVQRGGARTGMGEVWSESAEDARTLRSPIRPGQSSVEGRGDLQAPEGQLHRPEVRPMPARVPVDGASRWLRDGAPPSNGAVDRPRTDANRVREPHQPEPAGQPPRESGAVPNQRGSQARRSWPICERCSQPVVPRGLGTALKPAHEPIVVARKPLVGTVAANVLAHGTGALNIDGCRVAGEVPSKPRGEFAGSNNNWEMAGRNGTMSEPHPAGRWPANVALDETAAAALDHMSGELAYNPPATWVGGTPGTDGSQTYAAGIGTAKPGETRSGFADHGGASRFFYTAKAGSDERITYTKPGGGNGRVTGLGGKVRQCNVCETRAIESGAGEPSCGHGDYRWAEPTTNKADVVSHPTVKPLSLMRWLVRLVTPPGGVILEPFAGSGTTVEAALLEGFRCVAIEREPDYLPLITQRLNRRRDPVAYLTAAGEDLGLFGDST